jgi:uncharacterized membrane protein YwzB
LAAPSWFFGFGSMMELIAFVIAIAVAYQALKAYNLSKEKTLLYLNLSFVLIGAGLLVDGLASLIVLVARVHRGFLYLFSVGYTINFLAQVLAYGLLVYAYARQARSLTATTEALAAVPVLFFERNAVTELILIFFLVYIAIQTATNYSVNKNTNSMLVFGAFTSLSIAHVFFLIYTVKPLFYPFAHIAQLFGFLLLLAMLLRVNRPA